MSELKDFISSMETPPLIACIHLGLRDDGWLHDLWHVELSYKNNKYRTEYRTGIGLRKPVLGLKKNLKDLWTYGGHYNLTSKQAADKNLLLKEQPCLADVLSSLLSDSSGANESFNNWCDDLGYDTDSRSALDIYLKCQETRNSLIKMFGLELFNKLSLLEH